MHHWFREYFTLHRKEQRGFIALAILLLAVIALPGIYNYFFPPKFPDINISYLQAPPESDSLDNKTSETNLFVFDPNKSSAMDFEDLGIDQEIVERILLFREKGGRFYQRDDFLLIYGISKTDYLRLRKYIRIERKMNSGIIKGKTNVIIDINKSTQEEWMELWGIGPSISARIIKYRNAIGGFDSINQLKTIYGIDSVLFHSLKPQLVYSENPFSPPKVQDSLLETSKISLRIAININTADSGELTKLSGIGPVLAVRIIKYRNLLGGFYHTGQLEEVFGIDSTTIKGFKKTIEADSNFILKLNINRLSAFELSRHPYISRTLADQLIKLRLKKGKLTDLGSLKEIYFLNREQYAKIRHYISVE